MNNSRKVIEVYMELRQAVGDRAGSAEILACASFLVDHFTPDDDSPAYDLRKGGIPFDCWTVDAAMADGGWRVLGNESCFVRDLAEEEEHEQLIYQEFKRFNEERLSL